MNLEESRRRIDELDRSMQHLLEERMDAVESVAAYKMEHQMPVFRPEREAAILDAHTQCAKPGQEPYVYALFTTLMECSKCAQLIRIKAPVPPLPEASRDSVYRLEMTLPPEEGRFMRLLGLFAIHRLTLSAANCRPLENGQEELRFCFTASDPAANLPELMRSIAYYAPDYRLTLQNP